MNCGSTYNVTTSGDDLYEDGLILIVQFSSQVIGGGLYRWSQVTHGQHQTHLVSSPDPLMYASQGETRNGLLNKVFLGPSTECDKDQ